MRQPQPAHSTFSPQNFPPFPADLLLFRRSDFPPFSGRSPSFSGADREICPSPPLTELPPFPAPTRDLCPSPPLTELSTSFADRSQPVSKVSTSFSKVSEIRDLSKTQCQLLKLSTQRLRPSSSFAFLHMLPIFRFQISNKQTQNKNPQNRTQVYFHLYQV
jgi:hypothetical protein